jgi:glucose-1-phosphate cytidylyltransferase
MKAVILAGGFGTRLSEETHLIPKPMVEIGGRPMLWHVMKIYASHGVRDFVICLGYKGYVIKEYFANYLLHQSDVTIDLERQETTIHRSKSEPWRVTLVDTGSDTMTGGRIGRIREYVEGERFLLTYGDGVGDVDISASIAHHEREGVVATVTAVQPAGRFGAIRTDGSRVTGFEEKPRGDGGWINGGFFVLEPSVFDYIDGDDTVWERGPLTRLAKDGELSAYPHSGFWQPMDTLRDKQDLERLWQSGRAPWNVWDEPAG